MTVAHIAWQYGLNNTGGAAIAATRLHQLLIEHGVDSHYICVWSREYGCNVHVLPIGWKRLFYLVLTKLMRCVWKFTSYRKSICMLATPIWGLESELMKIDPDVVHVHHLNNDVCSFEQIVRLGRILKRNCKFVFNLHDLFIINAIEPYPGKDIRFKTGFTVSNSSILERWLFKRKQKMIAALKPVFVGPSEWVVNECRESIIGGAYEAVVINNVISSVFRFVPELRQRHNGTILLFGAFNGRHIFNKGFADLEKALRFLPLNMVGDIQLNIFGELESDYEINGVKVHFIGCISDQNELVRIYHSADILVFPSVQETQGMTKVEALLCGLPVIAFDRTACAEGINNNINGWIAKDGDIKSFAEGIVKYHSMANNIDHAAIADAAMNAFSSKGCVSRIINVYSSKISDSILGLLLPLFLTLTPGSVNGAYDISLAKCYYGDTPVIQHGVTNCVFGKVYENGIPVSGVCVDARIGSVKSVVSEPSGEDGSWCAYLPPMNPCSTPITLVLSIGGKDILAPCRFMVGDVWLCGGQSNMATRLSDSYDFESYIADATTDVRQYDVMVGVSNTPQEFSTPGGHWASSTSYTGAKAAVPFFFARALRKSGVTIPIGLVNVAANGKKIETFISPEMVAFDPVFSNEVANVVDAADGTRGFQHWNAMYEPFRRVKFKGMIWYQGEANINLSADEYGRRLLAFINGIRKVWGADFPFYSVQLASYGSWADMPEGQGGWTDVREGQFAVFRQIENSGLAVANDLFATDAHPKAKVLIADRLARCARYGVYGQDVEAVGPVIDKATYQGNRIHLTFKDDTIGCGIVIGVKDWRNNDEPVTAESLGVVTNINGFAISDDNATWYWADGYIATNSSIVLSNSVCAMPRYVHFSQLNCNVGWDNDGKTILAGGVNLYGRMKDGTLLPAFPFVTMKANPSEEPQSVAYDAIFCGADRYLTLDAACAANEATPFAWLVVTRNDMFMSAVRVADVYPRLTKFDSGRGLLQIGNAVEGLSYGISFSSDLTKPFSEPMQWIVANSSGMTSLEYALPKYSKSIFIRVIAK